VAFSSESLCSLLDALPYPTLAVKQDGEIAFASAQFEAVLGYMPAELVGESLEILLPLSSRKAYCAHREDFFRNPVVPRIEADQILHARHKNGAEVPVEVSLSPLETDDGLMAICGVRDVTRQHSAYQQLATEKAFTDSLIANMPTMILLLDSAGRVIKMNPFMERITGFSTQEVAGKDWFTTFLPEECRTDIRRLFHEVIEQGTNEGHVNAIVTADGSLQQIDWYARTLKDDSGNTIGILNVGYDVTERLRQEEEVKQARQMAERANNGKSQFLAAASHDLRQPLQSVGMYLAVLSKMADCPKQREIVGNIQSTLDMMSRLLNTLLDISRLENGSIAPEKCDFSIRELLDRVVNDNRPTASDKGLRFRCEVADYIINSDPVLLERVIENLVTNAIRYTNEGQVTIVGRARGDDLYISVTDTGIGIPGNALEKMFGDYVQLENSTQDRENGLGLGLGIVRRIAEALGHSLEVSSEPGVGSTFSIHMPLGQSRELDADSREQLSTPLYNSRTPVVLLVDDDAAIVDAATMLLESAEFEVHCAGNGDAAIELVESGVCADVVISDFRLPGYDGIELIRRIRRISDEQLPAILMTGDTSAGTIERANLPNCTVFRKPVDTERLIAMVAAEASKSERAQSKVLQKSMIPDDQGTMPLELISSIRRGRKTQGTPLLTATPPMVGKVVLPPASNDSEAI
jgi:PAS domain S-box-containing protein